MQQWTLKEIEAAGRKAYAAQPDLINAGAGCHGLTADAVAAIMTSAVELARARGGTMTAAALADLAEETSNNRHQPPSVIRDLLSHLTTQGATVATLQANDRASLEQLTHALGWKDGGPGWQAAIDAVKALQAKVEKLEKRAEIFRKSGDAVAHERDALRAEVERLTSLLDGERQMVAAFKESTETARAECQRLLSEVERLKARKWIQCTSVSNECLGGCASMAEHDRHRHQELNALVETCRRHHSSTLADRRSAEAEVEGLKAENHHLREDWTTTWRERAETAESRLAAIREKTHEQLDAFRRAIATEKAKPRPSQARIAELQMAEVALEPLAKVLEGDAPKEATTPNTPEVISTARQALGMPPQEAPTVLNTCICNDGATEMCLASRHPCSPTCTHEDAATPGHLERVRERGEAVWAVVAPDSKCHAPKHINCPCSSELSLPNRR